MMTAKLTAVYELDFDTRWKYAFSHTVAIDPIMPAVHMSNSHGRTRSGITNYVVVYGDYNQKRWRFRLKAWSLEEAIEAANKKLARIPDELLTAKEWATPTEEGKE